MEKKKVLKESVDEIKVYMNTWANYNENGADLSRYGIKNMRDGWLSIDEAREFAEKYKEDEPFINDLDNVPFDTEINEYSYVEDALDLLERLNDLDEREIEEIQAIQEATGYPLDQVLDIFEDKSYIYIPGVTSYEELAQEYIDNIGGITEISNPETYIDTQQLRRDLELEFDDSDLRYEAEKYVEKQHQYTEIAEEDIPNWLEYDLVEDIGLDEETDEDEISNVVFDLIEEEFDVAPEDFDIQINGNTVTVTNIQFAEEDKYNRDDEIQEYIDNHRDDWIDNEVDEYINLAENGELSNDFIESYFDYEAYGKDLEYSGYTLTENGAIVID